MATVVQGQRAELAGAVGRFAAVMAVVARIEARRPAAWIALVTAGGAAALLERAGGGMAMPAAVVSGGLAALAAIGGLVRRAEPPRPAAAWWIVRSGWPLAGAAFGGLASAIAGHGVVAAWGVVAGALVVAAAAAVVPHVANPWREWPHVALAPGRPWGEWIAMPSCLAAMVVCYFLIPELAPWYAVIATGWFVVLAVPAATLAAGAADAFRRDALLRSAVAAARLPGTLGHAFDTIVSQAAVLGWPAVVAAVLRGPEALAAGGPVVAVGVLAAVAAATALAAWIGSACRVSGETTLAALTATLAAALVAAACRSGGAGPG